MVGKCKRCGSYFANQFDNIPICPDCIRKVENSNRIAELEEENERLHETISAYEDKCLDMEYAKLKVMEELSELQEVSSQVYNRYCRNTAYTNEDEKWKRKLRALLSADKGDG